MNEQEQPIDALQTTALHVLEIMPLIMQIVTTELRQAEYTLVPTHLGVLSVLAQRPHNLSELAEFHGVSLPTMSGIISRMTKDGWVERQRDPSDRRKLIIDLTANGRLLLAQILGRIVTRLTALLAPLKETEQEKLQIGLGVLRHVLVNDDSVIWANTIKLAEGV